MPKNTPIMYGVTVPTPTFAAANVVVSQDKLKFQFVKENVNLDFSQERDSSFVFDGTEITVSVATSKKPKIFDLLKKAIENGQEYVNIPVQRIEKEKTEKAAKADKPEKPVVDLSNWL